MDCAEEDQLSSVLKGQRVCFVSMPFGIKRDPWTDLEIDFDKIYVTTIKPAVEAEGGTCLRREEELSAGVIHKPTFSRLIHADVMITDLTTANPRVLYELGIRHATRSRATIPIVGDDGGRLPFDPLLLRPVFYTLENGSLTPESAVKLTNELHERLDEALNSWAPTDSPIFFFLDDFAGVDLAKVEKTAELFLSYARVDEERVVEVYDKLWESYSPWMDVRDLLPGEPFEVKIGQAIERADFFLAFLSQNSVDRRGLLRKELRQALEKWKGMLEDDIYLIPVRLEQCEIPNELGGFQVLDLFAPDGWNRLDSAIRSGMNKRLAEN